MNPEEQKQAKTAEKVQPSRWRIFLLIALALLTLIIIFIIYRYASQPANGVINQANPEVSVAVEKQNEKERFESQYLSFSRSSAYVLKRDDYNQDANSAILEQAFFSETSVGPKKIALTVRSLPSRNLEDCPDYKMRIMKNDLYAKEKFSFENETGVAFILKEQGIFEKTIFLLHGDLLAEISLSVNSASTDQLNQEADELARSIIWKKTRNH